VLKKLFVISPIGEKGKTIRKQADAVLDIIKAAAAKLYIVQRGDQSHELKITEAIERDLKAALVAVAYLGTAPWNPNVMFEVGYRLALAKPLILISHEKDELPFDVAGLRSTILLPSGGPLAYLPKDVYEGFKKQLRAAIKSVTLPQDGTIKSDYPVADIRIDRTPGRSEEERAANSIFIRCSEAANELFHVRELHDRLSPEQRKKIPQQDTLVGLPINAALAGLEPLADQWDEFLADQHKLLGKLFGYGFADEPLTARVPFVFKQSDASNQQFWKKAFIGVIVDQSDTADAMYLRILYYQVPHGLKWERTGHRSYLITHLADLPELDRVEREAREATATPAPLKG